MLTLDIARVDYLIRYEPETGAFTWKVTSGRRAIIGTLAGWISGDGYRMIQLDGRAYPAHRIAWALTRGAWPTDQIDHINGVRLDNRICNLREATPSENRQNRRKKAAASSRFKGVCWHKATGKWSAYIMAFKRRRHLGLFDNEESAYAAYCVAAKEMHGEFAQVEAA